MKKPWAQYFLDIAEMVATRSPDPSTQVGTVIVNSLNHIVSTGYNGFPRGCDESKLTLERPLKYFLIVHSEDNAISHCDVPLNGCSLYTTQAPCENCLKKILSVGIVKVVFRHTSVVQRFTDVQKTAIRLLLSSKPDILITNERGESYLSLLEREVN